MPRPRGVLSLDGCAALDGRQHRSPPGLPSEFGLGDFSRLGCPFADRPGLGGHSVHGLIPLSLFFGGRHVGASWSFVFVGSANGGSLLTFGSSFRAPPGLHLGRVWRSRGSAWRSSSRGSSSFGFWRSGGPTWLVPTPPPSLHFGFHRGLGPNVPYPRPQSVCRLTPISSHGSWGVLWGVSASCCHGSSCLQPCSGSVARS